MQSHLILWADEFTQQEYEAIRNLDRQVECGKVFPFANLGCDSYCTGSFEECKRYWKRIPLEARHLFFVLEVADDGSGSNVYCARLSANIKQSDIGARFMLALLRYTIGKLSIAVIDL
jgi:hypothetical protein